MKNKYKTRVWMAWNCLNRYKQSKEFYKLYYLMFVHCRRLIDLSGNTRKADFSELRHKSSQF